MSRIRRQIDRVDPSAGTAAGAGALARAVLLLASLGAAATAIFVGATVGRRWVTTSPTFAIQSISISGNRRASADELVRLSGLVPGSNLFEADLDAAERAIAQQPWVKSAEVHRRLPHTVQVRVTEREPALVVDLGKLYFADRDGTLFKRALGGDDLDLPVVTGLSRQQFQEQREQIEAHLRELVAFVDGYHARNLDQRYRLEELSVDEDDGLTLQLQPAKKGELQTVKLGNAPFEDRLEKLATLWDEFERRGVHAQVVRLDNRTRPNWVAVKLALTEPADPAQKPAPVRPHN